MRHAKLLNCVTLFFLCAALAGCGFLKVSKKSSASSAPTAPATIIGGVVTNPGLGFKITFPTTWNLTDHANVPAPIQGTRMLTNVAKSGASVRVKVLDIAPGTTLKSFTTSAMAGSDKVLKNFELSADEDLKIGTANAHRYTFFFEGATTKARTKTESYSIVQGSRGYIITTAALSEDYDKYAPEIDTIVQSFALLAQ